MIGFPKRWHHGHSLGIGTLVGWSLVSYRAWLILALGVAIGVVGTLLVCGGYRLARTLHGSFEAWRRESRAKRETIRSEPAPVYSMRRAAQSDKIPF